MGVSPGILSGIESPAIAQRTGARKAPFLLTLNTGTDTRTQTPNSDSASEPCFP
jgi:hypothetical protein